MRGFSSSERFPGLSSDVDPEEYYIGYYGDGELWPSEEYRTDGEDSE